MQKFHNILLTLILCAAPAAAMRGNHPSAAERRQEMIRKLDTIIIPEIDFREADIHTVVDFLVEAARHNDPAPDRQGVNIILMLHRPADALETPTTADTAEPSRPPVAPQAVAGPTVSMRLRNIPLRDAIMLIAETNGLRYRVVENAVILTPSGMVLSEDLVTRTYRVPPETVRDLTGR